MADGPSDTISRAYKVELRPTAEQASAFAQWAGVRRYCWNRGVGMLNDQLSAWREAVDAFSEANGLDPKEARKNWRTNKDALIKDGLVLPKNAKIDVYKTTSADRDDGKPWIGDPPASMRAQVDRGFREVLSRYYKGKVGRPRFQSRYSRAPSFSLQIQSPKPFDGDWIVVPKIGRVLTCEPVESIVQGRVTKFTISRDVDRWFCAITVLDCPRPDPTTKTHACGGVDLNTHSFVFAHDTGHEVFAVPPSLVKVERKIKHTQRELQRRRRPRGQPASANYIKTRTRLAKLYRKQRRIRVDWLHKITRKIASTCARVVIEDLSVRGMTRSAKGSAEQPGNRVRQKAGLNRVILSACFGEFRRQMEYKADWYGCELVMADRFYPSSKTCSQCGTVREELRLGEKTYRCGSCGLVMDRDLNAAVNLRDYKSSSASAEEGPGGTGLRKPVDRDTPASPGAGRRTEATRDEAGSPKATRGLPITRDQTSEIPAGKNARKTGVSPQSGPRARSTRKKAVKDASEQRPT